MRSVGGYDVLSEIGRGSMGVVQLARQRDLDRLVALKELNRVHANTPELTERFVREARLAGSLNHPNIVTVFEAFEVDETPYIAMEYLPRGSLRPWVGNLTLAQLAGVLEGLLAGLTAAESAGIVHRDLKPENIMVAADGRVKIADFGIAKATVSTGTGSFLTATGTSVGTPAYMAPEQALARETGPWTDLYSLGVMTYEQLVGRLPFADSRSSTEILMRHVSETIPPVIESRPDVDPSLSDWVARLLLKEPERRTASATLAWDQLEEIVLDVLDPRWRRDSLLPARPGEHKRLESSDDVPAQPEAESRLLSYLDTPESTSASINRSASIESNRAQEPSDPTIGPDREEVSRWSLVSLWPSSSSSSASVERRSRRGLFATVLAGVLAIPIGFAVAPSHGGAGAAELSTRVSTRSSEVLLPSNWRRATAVTQAPGLKLDAPLTLSAPDLGGKLIASADTTSSATLLPVDLLSLLPGHPRGEAVRLGSAEFYRYRGLRPKGSSVAETIYAQPTTNGTFVGACLLPDTHSSVVEVDCERILGSLRLLSARALSLGPNVAYAEALSHAMSGLNNVRARAGQSLARARTSAAQSIAAEHLATAHRRAAATIGKSDSGPAARVANAALVTALTRLAGGYATIARAARSSDRGRFDAGRSVVHTGSAELATALAQLHDLGYKIGG